MTASATKSFLTLLTPNRRETSTHPQVTLFNFPLPINKIPTILGVKYDPRMTFTPHVKEITRKTTIKNKVLRTLTGTNFGQHKEILRTVYKQFIRPTLSIVSPVWYFPLSQANKDILQKLQNRSLRIITGCTATTPIYHLHNETKILTVKQHLEMIGTQFFSSTLNPNHPNHQLLHRQPPQRNKKMTPALLYS